MRTHPRINCRRARLPALAPSFTRIRARAHAHTLQTRSVWCQRADHVLVLPAVTLPPFLAAPSPRRSTLQPHLATKVRLLPHLAAPPRRSISPSRFANFASQSSPSHLADPPRRSTSLRPALWGPESVAAPSPGPDRWRLCLQAPTCPFTCPYGTDARGQSHRPLARP